MSISTQLPLRSIPLTAAGHQMSERWWRYFASLFGPNGQAIVGSVRLPIAGSMTGPIRANLTILRYVVAVPLSFQAGLAGSQGIAAAAATGSYTFSVRKNGSQFGTMVFAASGTVATFTGSATNAAAGDLITVVAPNATDATLEGISVTLLATANLAP